MPDNLPQQINGFDCGYYTISFAEFEVSKGVPMKAAVVNSSYVLARSGSLRGGVARVVMYLLADSRGPAGGCGMRRRSTPHAAHSPADRCGDPAPGALLKLDQFTYPIMLSVIYTQYL